jgi:hypothetical protein
MASWAIRNSVISIAGRQAQRVVEPARADGDAGLCQRHPAVPVDRRPEAQIVEHCRAQPTGHAQLLERVVGERAGLAPGPRVRPIGRQVALGCSRRMIIIESAWAVSSCRPRAMLRSFLGGDPPGERAAAGRAARAGGAWPRPRGQMADVGSASPVSGARRRRAAVHAIHHQPEVVQRAQRAARDQ